MGLLEIGKDILFIIASFFIGAIPFCYILGKVVGKKSLKEIGDKNPGGWNLIFNVSKIWGFIGIILDMAKGYLVYSLVLMFAYKSSAEILGTNHSQAMAVLLSCVAVAGHNYTPFLKWNGGKGLATWGGFIIAASWITLPVAGIGIVAGILFARNMIWGVTLGIVSSAVFLWLYTDAVIFLFSIILLLVIMLPKQINKNLALGKNFQFRKEATLQDLFKPKIR